MTTEKINEITKSFAFGMSESEVAAIEEIDLSEAERIKSEYAEEIAEKAKYYERRE